jgi:hypothetical protein
MLSSPWVTLVAVPLGFLLLAAVSASGSRGWTPASTVFASLAGLMVFAGGLDQLRRRAPAGVSRRRRGG